MQVYMQAPNFVINLAADNRAPQGTMSSAATMMTISFYTSPQFDYQSMISIDFIRPDKVTKKTMRSCKISRHFEY